MTTEEINAIKNIVEERRANNEHDVAINTARLAAGYYDKPTTVFERTARLIVGCSTACFIVYWIVQWFIVLIKYRPS